MNLVLHAQIDQETSAMAGDDNKDQQHRVVMIAIDGSDQSEKAFVCKFDTFLFS